MIFIAARKLTIKLSVKTLKTRTVHFVSSLEIFFFPHVTITSIAALGVFANVCLVLLLPLAGSLVLKFLYSDKTRTFNSMTACTLYPNFSINNLDQLRISYIATRFRRESERKANATVFVTQ